MLAQKVCKKQTGSHPVSRRNREVIRLSPNLLTTFSTLFSFLGREIECDWRNSGKCGRLEVGKGIKRETRTHVQDTGEVRGREVEELQ